MNDQEPASTGHKRPTLWIALTAVFALAAIGLGIWAFTTKSDLDDEKDKVAAQNKQLAAARGVDEATLAKAKRTHARLARRIKAKGVEIDDLRRETKKEKAELANARSDAANANNAADRAQAELRASQARADAARTCAKGGLGALDDLLNAPTPKAGTSAATDKLSASESACDTAAG